VITWIASYPKSGNTWARALLAQYLLDRPVGSLAEIEQAAPDLTNLTNAGLLPRVEDESPSLLKTHFLPDVPLLAEFAEQTSHALYLVRDPRDVIRSAARHLDVDEARLAEFAELFVEHEGVPDWVLAGWGSWTESVAAWTSAEHVAECFPGADLRVVRYEDLSERPHEVLAELAVFLGIDDGTDAARIGRAVANSTIERLRAVEKASEHVGIQAYREPPRTPFIGTGRRGQSLAGLGERAAAGYRAALSGDGRFARLARQFGYHG
jgi:hypothetical protein